MNAHQRRFLDLVGDDSWKALDDMATQNRQMGMNYRASKTRSTHSNELASQVKHLVEQVAKLTYSHQNTNNSYLDCNNIESQNHPFQEEASWVDYQQRNSYSQNQNQRYQNPSPRWNEQGRYDSRYHRKGPKMKVLVKFWKNHRKF